MRLSEFNSEPADQALERLCLCADIAWWATAVVADRPYGSVDQLVDHAIGLSSAWLETDVEAALAHHPRVGERPEGAAPGAALSRREQDGVDGADAAVARALVEGNLAYERRFGRIFLVRAAGRDAIEILEQLTARLDNEPEQESRVVAEQLREIAGLRLRGLVTDE